MGLSLLFICIGFFPFWVEIRTLTSLAQVELGAFLFGGLLGFPFVQGHGFGLFFFGSPSGGSLLVLGGIDGFSGGFLLGIGFDC